MRFTSVLTTLGLLLVAEPARALPLYALAAGHTCANCHASPTYEDPNGWENPPLPDRKCNLSCVACHVDPAGQGIRNTAGRYFSLSTLPIFPLQERAYSDLHRELIDADTIRALQEAFGQPPPVRTSSAGRTVPSSYDDVRAGVGADRVGGYTSFGKPLGHPSRMSAWDGRYRDLNADPLISLGGDVRVALWSGPKLLLPVQLDFDLALHPIEHVTLVGTLAGRGKAPDDSAVIPTEGAYFFPRNAYVMLHELPYLAYLKAGIFMPAFGTRLDDRSSFIRDQFEQSYTAPEDRVLGVELGAAANYPYASVSFFRGFRPFTGDVEPPVALADDPGWGGAAMLGWRDLGWSLGAQAILKRRDALAGGNLNAVGFTWGLSPYRWWDSVPLSLIGELSIGRRPLNPGSEKVTFLALYQEAIFTPFNGVSLRAKYDLGSVDLSDPGALAHRLSLGLDTCIFSGLTLVFWGRLNLVSSGGDPEGDVVAMAHVWF